jgi:hypothetical protein
LNEYGQWSEEVVEGRSSNWREFTNLVEFLERSVKGHELDGSEIFIFTDNTTSEAAFWKGTSSFPLLFNLVLRLRKLEMDANLIIHVVHVSGKRMIDQGTDGLSRADHSQGAVVGKDIHHWVPLNQSMFTRSKGLEEWLGKVLGGLGFGTLSPEGWFTTGHKFGNHVWAPPPAACDAVVEQLGKARLKKPESTHLVVAPRLMTGRWRRHLGQGSDEYFKIQDSPNVRELTAQFEPLLIFVCLPYVSHSPKLEQRAELLDEFQRSLQGEDLQSVSVRERGRVLRKLLESARALCPLSGSVVPLMSKRRREH